MHSDRLDDIKRGILLSFPHFAPILLRAKVEVTKPGDPLNPMDSASVSYGTVRFCETWLDALSDKEVATVWAHEVMHAALLHLSRQGHRTQIVEGKTNTGQTVQIALSNIAQDYVVNGFLEQAGFQSLKSQWLRDTKYDGLSWEQVYDLLLGDLKKQAKTGFDCHLDGEGEGDQGGKPSASELRQIEREWQRALSDCLALEKQRGNKAGALERMLQDSLETKVPWSTVIADRVRRIVGRDDYTWKRPSRQGAAMGLYLPSQYSEAVPCVVFCFDTSGSMWNDPLLEQAFAETRAALESLRIDKAVLIQADVEVHKVEDVTDQTALDRTLKGGGGTSFKLALERAREYNPTYVIYFTDLEGEFPAHYDARVIWITKRAKPVPFGEVIEI